MMWRREKLSRREGEDLRVKLGHFTKLGECEIGQ